MSNIGNKYHTLKPPLLISEKINTINIPKFNMLGKKLRKTITQRSRKNNTTINYEYKNWWVDKGEKLVKKIKQHEPMIKKKQKGTKLTPSERKWKTKTMKLEASLYKVGSGKTKRKHKKRKATRKK
jgi:hypothetical protein